MYEMGDWHARRRQVGTLWCTVQNPFIVNVCCTFPFIRPLNLVTTLTVSPLFINQLADSQYLLDYQLFNLCYSVAIFISKIILIAALVAAGVFAFRSARSLVSNSSPFKMLVSCTGDRESYSFVSVLVADVLAHVLLRKGGLWRNIPILRNFFF